MAAGQGDGRFADAHRALLADPDVQLRLAATPPPPETPAWMRTLGEWIAWGLQPIVRFFAWLGSWLPDWPYGRILLWSVIALAAALALWMVIDRIRHGVWRLPRWCRQVRAEVAVLEDEPLFEAAPARAWLREADALAAVGRFAEAAHHLLFRSVEDIGRRRPRAVRPALTSRELAAAEAIPSAARALFARIAAQVERSLFGGRPVDAGEWTAARASYAELALPRAWR